MDLSLSFSPCPNDTFIFDALIHGKIDTEGLHFNVSLADVEELNKLAFEGKSDITKLSYAAYSYVAHNYKLLTSGSALGYKNGPLLIAKRKISPAAMGQNKVAIPGKYTTAHLLFSIRFPEVSDKKEILFSKIEEAVLKEEVDAGVIIHENRFTYRQKGLIKIEDLGESWEKRTGHAIPLGGIAIHRKLGKNIHKKVNRVLKRSIDFALKNPESGTRFVQKHAQEMDHEVIKKHIDLYVNSFTLELGGKGMTAIEQMFSEAKKAGFIPSLPQDIFVT